MNKSRPKHTDKHASFHSISRVRHGTHKAERLFFHGTGARRHQSIRRRGLLPKLNSYVYACSDPRIAAIFAVGRAEQEDDTGLIVTFKAGDGWEVDPQFPHSYRRREPITPSDIIAFNILTYEEEDQAILKLKQIAESIGIRVEP